MRSDAGNDVNYIFADAKSSSQVMMQSSLDSRARIATDVAVICIWNHMQTEVLPYAEATAMQ